MSDHPNLIRQSSPRGQNSSPSSPASLIDQVIVSSRHPRSSDTSCFPSPRSSRDSNSTNSRHRTATNVRSSIQMEPGLQSLLIAEGRAAEMIATARVKRNELLQQANRESEAEIEAFREERELQYQMKLHEATQLERFQVKLDTNQRYQLDQLERHVKQNRTSVINYIVHCVIDPLPIQTHRNPQRMIW